MVAFTKINQFVQDVGRGVHNLDADDLKIALTNTAPNVSTAAVLADITEIAAGGGYVAGGFSLDNVAYSQSGGVGSLTGDDEVFTASGASVGPLRYAVLYNGTSPSDSLIGYWDYGSSITLNDGEPLNVDFGATILTLT